MSTPSRAELVVAGAELAALGEGPWAGAWYWREDLEAQQVASRRMGYPDDHPCAVMRRYRPTDTWHNHPKCEERARGVRGCGWIYQPAEQEPSASLRASTAPPRVPGVACQECGQQLLLVRPGRTQCERCRVSHDRERAAYPAAAGPTNPAKHREDRPR